MIGPLFLYSTTPTPHESTILARAQRHHRDPTTPLSIVVLQTPLEEPADTELDGLRSHFCGRDIAAELHDSGLADRDDASRPAVIRRLATADLVLITGGSPTLLFDRTIDTQALAALRTASAGGTVIAGCSAGALTFGAGMQLREKGPRPLWGWLPRTLIAPHYGGYDVAPWLDAFPDCVALGIPDGAMALIEQGRGVRAVGDQPLAVVDRLSTRQLALTEQFELPH